MKCTTLSDNDRGVTAYPHLTLSADGNHIEFTSPDFADQLRVRLIQSRTWTSHRKVWLLPLTHAAVNEARVRFPRLDVCPSVLTAIDNAQQRIALAASLKDDTAFNDWSNMPIKVTPYKHQVQAFRVAMALLAG